jgi:hypothetical protein
MSRRCGRAGIPDALFAFRVYPIAAHRDHAAQPLDATLRIRSQGRGAPERARRAGRAITGTRQTLQAGGRPRLAFQLLTGQRAAHRHVPASGGFRDLSADVARSAPHVKQLDPRGPLAASSYILPETPYVRGCDLSRSIVCERSLRPQRIGFQVTIRWPSR